MITFELQSNKKHKKVHMLHSLAYYSLQDRYLNKFSVGWLRSDPIRSRFTGIIKV